MSEYRTDYAGRIAGNITDLVQIYRVLDAVRSCPERGAVLPHTLQPECVCAELTECRARLGPGPDGAVRLEDCVRCRSKTLPDDTSHKYDARASI